MALKKSQLYSSLWKSCDELRGGMDAAQYKDYILTLLFVKYVSDKYAGCRLAPIVVPPGGAFADMVRLKGNAEIGDLAQQLRKLVLVGAHQACGRLVEQDEFRVEHQDLCEFDEFLLAVGQRLCLLIAKTRHADECEQFLGMVGFPAGHRGPAQLAGVVGSAVAIPGGAVAAGVDDGGGGDCEDGVSVFFSPQAAINAVAAALPTPSSASRRRASRRLSRPST